MARTASVVVYDEGDIERIAELRMIAESRRREEDAGSTRLGDESGAAAAQAEYDAFVEEAAERATVIKVRSIGRGRFRDLLLKHPPRKVDDGDGGKDIHPDDYAYEADVTTLPDALLTYVDADDPAVRTIVEPSFPNRAACEAFLNNDLDYGDFEKLWNTAYWLNAAPGADPKASRYSLDDQSSIETLTSLGRLG